MLIWRLLVAYALFVSWLIGEVPEARAAELAGTAWHFGTPSGFKGEDEHNTLRAGGTSALRGSACCASFTVAFPTNETFLLLHESYEIASGTVRARRSAVALVPDSSSVGTLRWWAENQIESFWNAGVFALDLSLRASRVMRESVTITMRTAGGKQKATLKVAVRVGGTVLRVDRSRIRGNSFAPGAARGQVTYNETLLGTTSIDGLEVFPYPPEVPCGQESDSEIPAAWSGGPDYCYDLQ